ncbi:MAG: Na+/H+ antiporter NhaA, partial [Deltaproteobacteria bacterium]|nr:Na+/H+ antiporter NhaA [Deltaproteobacteria bacterium]
MPDLKGVQALGRLDLKQIEHVPCRQVVPQLGRRKVHVSLLYCDISDFLRFLRMSGSYPRPNRSSRRSGFFQPFPFRSGPCPPGNPVSRGRCRHARRISGAETCFPAKTSRRQRHGRLERRPLAPYVALAFAITKPGGIMLSKALKDFAHVQALAGLWTVIALILVLPARYALPRLFELVAAPVSLSSGPWTMIQPGIMWVNGIGAALIFLLIGLEIKRGFMEDELTGADRLRLPALAAVGGVAIPVLAHMVLHGHEPALARAWIVPAASDMALGLGVLALFGDKAPSG